MIIGFVGDVHGQVFHAAALAATWQAETGKRFDFLIQVGDMGSFPYADKVDASTERYLALDPSQADFSRLVHADGELAKRIRSVRERLASPIYFIRGNHEDFGFLRQLRVDEVSKTAEVDRFDLFRYVPDGTVLQLDDLRIAVLGGIELETPDDRAIDLATHESLMALDPGRIDVLVTHDPPYGTSIGYRGQTQGSRLVTKLIERMQPAFHVSGHIHHLNGPRNYGRTASYSLAGLVASARWSPDKNGFVPGCLAVLDTEVGELEPVSDEWLTGFDTKGFEFESWSESL